MIGIWAFPSLRNVRVGLLQAPLRSGPAKQRRVWLASLATFRIPNANMSYLGMSTP